MNWTSNGDYGIQATFPATLLSIGDELKVSNSENGTRFVNATIEFVDDNEEVQRISAIVWEGSLNKMPDSPIGQKFVATAKKQSADADIFVSVGHLLAVDRARDSMFGMDESLFAEVSAESEHEVAGK